MDEFVSSKEILSDHLERTGDIIRRAENAIDHDNDTYFVYCLF
jgi:hypothetical protein